MNYVLFMKNNDLIKKYEELEEDNYINDKSMLELYKNYNIEDNIDNIKIEFESKILKHDFWNRLSFYFRMMLSYYIFLFKKYDKFNIEKFFNRLQWIDIKKYSKLIDINKPIFKDISDYSKSLDIYNSTKKIYSSSPYMIYNNYNKLKIWEKLFLLYENKFNNKNIYSKWWSCHNWSLVYISLLEKLNDILKKKITYKIIIFWVHSFVVFRYKNKWYYFDTSSNIKFYPQYLKIWDTIDIWNWYKWEILSIYPNFEVKINNLEEKKWKQFRKKNVFINYLDNRKIDYILVEYKIYDEKNPENNKLNLLKIYISNRKLCINLTINWKNINNIKYKNYKIRDYVEKNYNNLTSKIIFKEILKRTKFTNLLKIAEVDIDPFFNIIDPSSLKKLILNNIETAKKL